MTASLNARNAVAALVALPGCCCCRSIPRLSGNIFC